MLLVLPSPGIKGVPKVKGVGVLPVKAVEVDVPSVDPPEESVDASSLGPYISWILWTIVPVGSLICVTFSLRLLGVGGSSLVAISTYSSVSLERFADDGLLSGCHRVEEERTVEPIEGVTSCGFLCSANLKFERKLGLRILRVSYVTAACGIVF